MQDLKRGDLVLLDNQTYYLNYTFVAYIEGSINPYVLVNPNDEEQFRNGEPFRTMEVKKVIKVTDTFIRLKTAYEKANYALFNYLENLDLTAESGKEII